MPINWDDPNVNWDSGLQWDINNGDGLGNVEPYLDLITSEHQGQPNFFAALTALLQPSVDQAAMVQTIPGLFDFDVAVGAQLDAVGLWIGVTRYLSIPLTGVYFTFNDAVLGFDSGSWQGPGNPVSEVVALDDEAYRLLLRARIAANHWDGTIPGAYAIWQTVFAGTGYGILIVDHGDMSMDLGLFGRVPDAVTLALFTGGFLDLRPCGVRLNGYIVPTDEGPFFGFDADSDALGGFDVGSWATFITP